MNILGIDFGTKNIGLAWCDTDIGVVLPYGIIKNEDGAIEKINNLVNEDNIEKIVFGLPVGVQGSGEKNISRVKDFAEKLKNKVDCEIDFYDERFSSQQADQMGGEASRDEKSAMVILQSYLEKVNN